jgi:hypothetical protein
MNRIEETIEGTLDSRGQLQLTHQPQLPPGPVHVTIRVAAPGSQRGLADVIREIAAEQRSRGFPGRSAADLQAEDAVSLAEDTERDRELIRRAAESHRGRRVPRFRGRGGGNLPRDQTTPKA